MVDLITGGAGFIGRWVVKRLLLEGKKVVVIDNLKNGRKENLEDFKKNPNLIEFFIEDIKNKHFLMEIFKKYEFSTCYHLAAQINVQESLDFPDRAFVNNVLGTYNILEAARIVRTKLIIIGTCMVYDLANSEKAISEIHPIKPISPYAGSKVAAEELALSYYYSFDLPVVILRPFNTYGPFQKTNMEGGVVSIFVNRKLNGKKLLVYGTGTQTRDLLYVEDCVDFIIQASKCEQCVGEIINAGTGIDISMNNLAKLIIEDPSMITHVAHHHPQSEIMKLVCNYSKAKKMLNWEPKTNLKEGISYLEAWMREIRGDKNGETSY